MRRSPPCARRRRAGERELPGGRWHDDGQGDRGNGGDRGHVPDPALHAGGGGSGKGELGAARGSPPLRLQQRACARRDVETLLPGSDWRGARALHPPLGAGGDFGPRPRVGP